MHNQQLRNDISSLSSDSSGKLQKRSGIKLKSNLFEGKAPNQWILDRTASEWVESIFPDAAVFRGFDELLWGYFIIAVYREPMTKKLSSLVVDKLGITHFSSTDISRESRFHPAIENLTAEYQKSNVRKCIAVSMLQKFSNLTPETVAKIEPNLKYDYDPTVAGDLANSSQLVGFCSPADVGKSLDRLGFLQDRYVGSVLLDVVYENKQETIDSNNELVFHLGEQLEQLFNPLTEYSPEQTESVYKPPEDDKDVEKEDMLITSICNELLQVQTKFTLTLVEFLQKFLIPLRIKASNEEINALSIPKLNRLFPPTIDEVIRINCIFLDALKAATPHGSKEVLNACSVTIPYFYKAYTRHEAATKNFSKDIKLFMTKFKSAIPSCDVYTELRIETIMKGPQEIILKLKLILERLWSTKEWKNCDLKLAEARYSKVIEIIDSFGNVEQALSSYSTRVFTPSGKILTELAKGWPIELQYKWLKRRVVGVFDVTDSNDTTQKYILVIFSDFIVVLKVIDDGSYYDKSVGNKPLLSDVLMNSLINEVPLPPKISQLQVHCYSYIDNAFASTFGEKFIRIDYFDEEGTNSIALQIISSSVTASQVSDLILKAKVLEKDTAFHLFRYSNDELQIFSTAHEMEAYSTENIRSRFALFLNIKPSISILKQYDLAAAFFASISERNRVKINSVTIGGVEEECDLALEELAEFLVQKLADLYPIYYSTAASPLLPQLLAINEQLVRQIGRHFYDGEHVSADFQEPQEHLDINTQASELHTKSFGTLTTFRSYNDDLKDSALKSNDKKIASNSSVIKGEARAQRGKERPVKNGKAHRTNGKKAKRNSIVSMFTNLFSRKKDSQHRTETEDDTNDIEKYKGVVKQKVEVADKGGQTRPKPVDKPRSRPHQKRTASVIHRPSLSECATNSRPSATQVKEDLNIERGESDKRDEGQEAEMTLDEVKGTIHEPNAFVSSGSGVVELQNHSDTPATKNNQEKDEYTAHDASVLESDLASGRSAELRTKEGTPIYALQETGRESKVFNADLYGDVFMQENGFKRPDSLGPESSKVNISQQTVHIQQNKEVFGYSLPTNDDQHDIATPKNLATTQPQQKSAISNTVNSESENVEFSSPKKDIFPEIQKLVVKNVIFDRSPSFRELFDSMRIVLDESDERSNWKRLSNDPSFTEIAYNESKRPNAVHAFKSLVPSNRPIAELSFSISSEVQQKTLSVQDEKSESLEPLRPSDNLGVSLDLKTENSCRHSKVESIEGKKDAGGRSPFKVVNCSPSKIISLQSTPSISLNSGERHKTSDVFLSDISCSSSSGNVEPRLLEMSFSSKEEIDAKNRRESSLQKRGGKLAYKGQGPDSIVQQPVSLFTKENTTKTDFLDTKIESTPVGHSAVLNDNNQATTSENVSITDNHGLVCDVARKNDFHREELAHCDLLDDPEFSTFHMTFDGLDEAHDASDVPTSLKDPELSLTENHIQPPEPLFYRFPATAKSNDTFFSCHDEYNKLSPSGRQSAHHLVAEQDDPIWISPSKLEIFDISMHPDLGLSKPQTRLDYLENKNDQKQRQFGPKSTHAPEEQTLLSDSSYAYLGPLLTEDNRSDESSDDHGPVRLRFHP
ncbi:LAQU0S02e04236g1_1 [Lachancea quebecensis]|uniref:LAQU0S02e04236g1_1 n=1 Tax=Lachancea quebecensis TaxID=1654605 RepID=A0A0P1KM21_9SACH|nr:LAQU0S02e04236g1_1 [Lachancea quebecensis]